MSNIYSCEVPATSSLRRYKDGQGFADCYVIEVPGHITQAAFIEAFYTSPLFKIERTILKYAVGKTATDADVRQLAQGKVSKFSAWRVESQTSSELLLADFMGNTRSWLMAVPSPDNRTGAVSTLLYFGSAVVARTRKENEAPRMGWQFRALLGFHRLYSRLLLKAASKRVRAA